MATDINMQDTRLSQHETNEVKNPVSEADWKDLRRVPDKLPMVALLILVVELGERFTYFGLSGPIQNYINNPHAPGSDLPGALGKGQAVATALGNFFKFWAYASTIIGAIIADQYLGKFKTILMAAGIYIVGLVILVATATPSAIQSGAGFGGLIVAMVTIGLGTGGIKANVTPMCAEQYQNARPMLKTLSSGERVVVDPEITVQKLFMWFYWVVNVGALSPLITVTVEAKHSFWLAYLIPLIAIVLSVTIFLVGQKRYVKVPPQSSAIVDAIKTTTIACREKGFQNAKPSYLYECGKGTKYSFTQAPRYTDSYVEDVRRGVKSCKVRQFFDDFLPPKGLTDINLLDLFVLSVLFRVLDSNLEQPYLPSWSNGATRYTERSSAKLGLYSAPRLHRVVVYPGLRKMKIDFDPISRIFAGFLLASISMVYASVLQHFIYTSEPKSVHVWIQGPAYILVALSEAFIIITGLELAFTQAPKNLRSFISALFWVTIGVAAAICIALSPVSQDPHLVWMYGSLAVVGFVAGCLFFICFRKDRRRSTEAVILEALRVETNDEDSRGQRDKSELEKGV
ncbi:hypothetical protein OPT61_g1203 [Boeremia exigua]|uniref:Uncharacterized protein n=1 Tax=Boeremia exigua TaxID=749465 RepID=A0ACC2IR70_9PLEO|nr:hypothetical protein OPT61_g1203 [Boeremia exigua]